MFTGQLDNYTVYNVHFDNFIMLGQTVSTARCTYWTITFLLAVIINPANYRD